jgi:GNAT superfamily N-acetyltransferase
VTDLLIREATIDDVPEMARIRSASFPWWTASVANQQNWFRTLRPQARSRRLIAERDGSVIGFGNGGFNLSTTEAAAADCLVVVDPAHRRQGVGGTLFAELDQHLRAIGAGRARAYVGPDGLDWAAARGFAAGARDRYSKVDTSALPAVPQTPPGATLASFAEAGPELVYALDMAGSIDEPGDISYDGLPYDVWLSRNWNSPDLLQDACTVVIIDGIGVSASFLEADLATGRGMSTGACTLREHRGRGLSKLAKSATLHKAAKLGVHTAITCNDYENAPMLAVNDWLGYQVFADEWSCVKTMSPQAL